MKDWLYGILVACIAALAPIQGVMATVGFLIAADFFTGMWAAHKRGEKISSAAMRRTISKAFIFQLTIISGFLLEHFILGDSLPIAKIVAGGIGMVEFKSILENANHIVGGDLYKTILSKLGSQNDQEKMVEKVIDTVSPKKE